MKEQGGLGERARICIVRGKLWRKQLKQVFRVKKLVGLPPQLKLLALALNCWLG